MKLPALLGLLAALAAVVPTAQAQPIYRCGNEYTRVPCPGGRQLEMTDTRSAAQRAEARRILAEEERRAHELERDRKRAESAIKPAAAGSVGPPAVTTVAAAVPKAAASAASAPSKSGATGKKTAAKKPAKTQDPADQKADFVAVVPPQPKPAKEAVAAK